MINKILIVVDYQYDFASPQGALSVPGADSIADNIQTLINDKSFDKIIYTMDTHSEKDYVDSEEAKIFPIHCEFNTPGWDFYRISPRNRAIKTSIEEGVFEKPQDFSVNEEFVFVKDKFSIWEGNSNYSDFFEINIPKDAEVLICGVATNYCVFMNAMGYSSRGYKNITIIDTAIKEIPDDSFDQNMIIMKNRGIKFA